MPKAKGKPGRHRGRRLDAPLPLVTRFQLAETLGVHHITVAKWEREGLPVEQRGRGARPSWYSLPQAVQWWHRREISALEERVSGPLNLDQERARQANRQAKKLDLEIQRREGELAPVAEMAAVVTEILGATRAGILALPAALAEALTAAARDGGPRAVERALREAITGALRELAAWRPPRARRTA